MIVKSLCCNNFRNISGLEINPCDEMNVIYGENAQGKTNLIEAIWLFTGAKSFRAGKDSSFIKFSCEKAKTKLTFFSEGTEKTAQLEFSEKKTAFINDKKLQNPALLAGNFNAIVFSPNDLSLIKDSPAVRRRFLDTAIGQLYPNYIGVLKNYIRAVMQRNQTVKEYRYDSTLTVMLDVFEKEIAQNGAKIIEYRNRFTERLKGFAPQIYSGLSSGKERLEIVYKCCCDGNELLNRLKENRREDMYSGVTSVGPHRDDLEFEINGISARTYGSQGQKRSVALSLKLSEAEVIKEIVGEFPVCLLDDVMSELDPDRQNFILNHIKGWQSFLTCCDPSNIKKLEAGQLFEIKGGRVIN